MCVNLGRTSKSLEHNPSLISSWTKLSLTHTLSLLSSLSLCSSLCATHPYEQESKEIGGETCPLRLRSLKALISIIAPNCENTWKRAFFNSNNRTFVSSCKRREKKNERANCTVHLDLFINVVDIKLKEKSGVKPGKKPTKNTNRASRTEPHTHTHTHTHTFSLPWGWGRQ